ncbi:MAG: DUF1566 domain-containing protein [Hylemonella sp.]|nr:DUF1566 domain-containing protein [Hylemonella sp.]
MKMTRWLLATACVGVSCCALAQGRFSFGADGAEVTDSQTGLIWRRCSVGQVWGGGTCTGTISTFTHELALAYAQSQTGWRLPNVKELSSIADKTRIYPAIDSTAFPTTISSIYWSSSPNVTGSISAWGVDFTGSGVPGGHSRVSNYPVRLVR